MKLLAGAVIALLALAAAEASKAALGSSTESMTGLAEAEQMTELFQSLTGLPNAALSEPSHVTDSGLDPNGFVQLSELAMDDSEPTPLVGTQVFQDSDIQSSTGFDVQTVGTLRAQVSAGDESVEGQSPRKEASKISESGNTKLNNLEKSVLKLAGEGASPGILELVEDIRVLLHDQMVGDINKTYNETNVDLNRTASAVWNCSSFWLSRRDAISVDDYDLSSKETIHRDCRKQELDLRNEAAMFSQLAASHKHLVDKYCNTWRDLESPGNRAPGSNCDVDQTLYSGNYWSIDYYEDQHAFWSNLFDIIHQARLKCEQAFATWQGALANATIALEKAANKTRECGLKQDDMDDASCEYKSDLDSECTSYDECYNRTSRAYEATWSSAQSTDDYLQDQMRAVLRIDCYLDTFNASDISAAIADCQAKDFRNDTRVTYYTFYPRAIPAQVNCGYNYTHIAGNVEYEDKYYADCYDLYDECDAQCCSFRRWYNATT